METMTINTRVDALRAYATVTHPDGMRSILLRRPSQEGYVDCHMVGLGWKEALLLADALDRLPYIQVLEVHRVDDDLQLMTLKCTDEGQARAMTRLLEDLPALWGEQDQP